MTKGRRHKRKAKAEGEAFGKAPRTAEVMTEAVLAASHLCIMQLTSPTPRGVHEEYDCVWSNCGKLGS